MNILVTGGAGYIGSHTCVLLLEAGYDVIIVDNLCNSDKIVLDRIEELTGKRPKFYELKVQDREKLEIVFLKFLQTVQLRDSPQATPLKK